MLRKIMSSVGIQIVGTLSSLMLVWLITRFYGVSIQGQFVLIKSWVDLAVVVASFGFPQSFIYAINKLNVSWQKLEIFTMKYIFVVFLFSWLATFIWFEFIQQQDFIDIYQYFFLALGVSGLTGFSLLRGLYLTKNDSKMFAFITILPNTLLFIFFLMSFAFFDKILNMPLLYFFSGLASCSLVFLFLGNFRKHKDTNTDIIPWHEIVKNGFNVFIQSIFGALLPLGTYWLMSKFGYSKSEIGLFSIALYIYIVFTLPLGMISPIFYNRWSMNENINLTLVELKQFAKVGLILVPILLIFYYLIPIILPFVFGKQILLAIPAARLLLIATFALYYNNLLSCFFMSQGYFKIMSVMMILKTLICYFTIIISLLFFDKTLEIISIAWLISEVIILVMLFLLLGQRYVFNK